MIIEKQRNLIIVRAHEKHKGMAIDIETGVQKSLTTNKPYATQYTNTHLARIAETYNRVKGRSQWAEALPNYRHMITTMTEAEAIVALFYRMSSYGIHRGLAHEVVVLQMFYAHKYEITVDSTVQISRIIKEHGLDARKFVKYVINNELQNINSADIIAFKAEGQGLDVSGLMPKQKEYLSRIMQRYGFDRDKLNYLIRKIRAEHIDELVEYHCLGQFFDLCELFEVPYNQKNFLNSFAKMKYTERAQRDAILQKKLEQQYDPKYLLDTENYYCVMPTTPKQFAEMGEQMSNCIGGYVENVASGRCKIVFVYDRATRKPVINIEVSLYDGRPELRQFLGFGNDWDAKNKHQNFYNQYKMLIENLK